MNFKTEHIAPCGINCATCLVFLRDRNKCSGCWSKTGNKPKHCYVCRIKNCNYLDETYSKFCYECVNYPCTRLKQMDKRYIANFRYSLIENLNYIRDNGIIDFLKLDKKRWVCCFCGGTISVHTGYCFKCSESKK